ncbi:NnrU family protein [Mariprofundus sp. NF]|uniref:NnrU family protein n=1 Tax=Mariprofundus sp. NF TaxID=2608716 RepID=UPI0015A1529E|nr:NnrU family protein [Mariprofundus sp. NF]
MELLIAGLIIFIGMHLIPTSPSLRNSLLNKLGEKGYKAVFALISLAGMALIVMGKGDADFVEIYEPPAWAMHVTGLLMLFALVAMVSFIIKSRLRKFTPHPMLWGVSFWATGHLFANGDLASLLLFGSFLLYSQLTIVTANRRGARVSDEKITLMQDGIALVVAALAYFGLMMFHASFTGISLMA